MCVVSMVMDHYREKWAPLVQPAPQWTITTTPISQAEIDEFRLLLARAREYDKRHHEPDCELDEKRQALKTLAGQLGVDISFV